VVYWFAMLIDAERIDRELRTLDAVEAASLNAAGFHEPQRLSHIRDARLADLARPLVDRWTPEQLIAYAQEQGRKKAVS
jgi:hypothetical protein